MIFTIFNDYNDINIEIVFTISLQSILTYVLSAIKQCYTAAHANGERRNALFILSNVSTASFEVLRKTYPKIMS